MASPYTNRYLSIDCLRCDSHPAFMSGVFIMIGEERRLVHLSCLYPNDDVVAYPDDQLRIKAEMARGER